MAAPVTAFGISAENLVTVGKVPDNSQGPGAALRLGGRGEQFTLNLWNGDHALAMEGSYWTAATATPGTGIALSVTTGTSFSDTQALLVLNNTDSLISAGGTGKSLYLKFVTLIVTTAPTSQTLGFFAHRIDTQTRGTAGTQLGSTGTAPKNINSGVGGSSVGQAYALGASAVSVAASANVRNVGRNIYRGQIPVVGDHITVVYGASEMAAGGVNLAATTASGITIFAPPVTVGPGHSYVMNEWATARAAALSGEIVMGWVER